MKKTLLLSSAFLILLTLSSVFAAGVTTTKVPVVSSQLPIVNTEKKIIKGLVILNDYYARDEKSVYTINKAKNGWVALDTADRDTFKVMLGRFAQDKNHIFSMGDILDKVDRASFVVISGTHGYASDDTTVFGPQGVIEGADPETFRLYTGRYGADAGQVYYM